MNSVIHFGMPASDQKRVADFYATVFGWKMKQYGSEMGNYLLAWTAKTDKDGMIKKLGAINGGFFPKSDRDNSIKLTIAVDDIEEAMKKVVAAGGMIVDGANHGVPENMPGLGKFIDIVDTEGNVVNLMQPE